MENGLKCTLDFSIGTMISADGCNFVTCSCDFHNPKAAEEPFHSSTFFEDNVSPSTDLGEQSKFYLNVNYINISMILDTSIFFPIPIIELKL